MPVPDAESRLHAADRPTPPTCPTHPGSLVRRYRSHGPHGPGVYLQCVPSDGTRPHLLEWPEAPSDPSLELDGFHLTPSELEVLQDAADGLTASETATKRSKAVETVKSQRGSILMKLGARNMTQAVAQMIRDGQLERRRAA